MQSTSGAGKCYDDATAESFWSWLKAEVLESGVFLSLDDGHLVLADLVKRKHIADKVMIFTDCQLWNSTNYRQRIESSMAVQWAAYKKIAPNAKLYLFDLAGYGTVPLQVLADDVHLTAGWSDKVFDVLESLEVGQDSLARVNEIAL